MKLWWLQAEVAHLVEHDLAKVGVAGSSPVFRSTILLPPGGGFFLGFNVALRDEKEQEQCGRAEGKALVVKLVDTQDLKSCDPKGS